MGSRLALANLIQMEIKDFHPIINTLDSLWTLPQHPTPFHKLAVTLQRWHLDINPYPASVAAPLAPNIFPVSSSIPGYPAPLANGTYPNVTTGYQPPSSSVYPPLSSGYPPSGTNYPDGPSYLPQSGYPNAAPYPGAGPNQTGVAPGSAGGWAM